MSIDKTNQGVWLNRLTLSETIAAITGIQDSFEWYVLNDKERDCYDDYDLMMLEKWNALIEMNEKLKKVKAEYEPNKVGGSEMTVPIQTLKQIVLSLRWAAASKIETPEWKARYRRQADELCEMIEEAKK